MTFKRVTTLAVTYSVDAFFEVTMTNRDFINIKIKDRFHKDYKLTAGEIIFAIFCTRILIVFGYFGLFQWMLQIATR